MLQPPQVMRIEELHHYLDHPNEAAKWLRAWGLRDVEKAHGNLTRIAQAGVTLDLLAVICDQLAEQLPGSSDPDMALNNLERFFDAARNSLSLATLFERDAEALPILLQIFATSQHLSDVLILDAESYDLLRITEGQPVAREFLVAELAAEITTMGGDGTTVAETLRRFKRRETLRIAYGDIIRNQTVSTVTRQISYLADAVVEAALQAAKHRLRERRGAAPPAAAGGRFVVLALGKLGGAELNYSSDIDLIFLYDWPPGADINQQTAAGEYFSRLVREVLKLLTESTNLGAAYRVDLRLRPQGNAGPMAVAYAQALHYYDTAGRTWERQAMVKARPIAGDLEFGRVFLAQLEPWIYRRYLSRADITGIKALKRRIEHRARQDGANTLNVKTGHGGIRDIEFVIQFLQLLNGGDLPALRTGNTLEAIAQLEQCGCLTTQERMILEANYAFLRKIEHRLQIMFDLQTHMLPREPEEMRRLAIRLGYTDTREQPALAAFEADFQHKTELNRKILDHLLHDAFSDEKQTEPESDLVLDPEPGRDQIAEILGKYEFQDVQKAYRNLMELATERIRFLSTRRCRHFLAAIAPQLLAAIARTPDPDSTLVNLSKVSDSLGGKGVLWELFSFNPPTLQLYVDLCSSSQFLSGILTSNPGMLDELLDSLLLDKLPSLDELRANLADLCRGAEDIEPALHSFKNAQQLGVGVRDILRKEETEATCGALSDIAQTCLEQITRREFDKLAQRWGRPMIGPGEVDQPVEREGEECDLVILAMGKFGGREMNYYSDLDLVFLYEADGMTAHPRRSRRDETTNNQHFFSELAQRIIKVTSQLGPYGRLYEIDPRLRPTGRSGPLSTSLGEFRRYFHSGEGQLWERQALCKARVVCASPRIAELAAAAVREAAFVPAWQPQNAEQIWQMRQRLEETATPGNLKRGPGGLVDIEFLVQMLQLKHAQDQPQIAAPSTIEALDALHAAGALADEDHEFFVASYSFLRTVQLRMRLMNTTARDVLPDDPRELAKLAKLLGYASAEALTGDCQRYTSENRRRAERIFEVVAV
ncbi:MAG: bifunctional [glutamate--ammonia ligase]-adenylyl-L-tyrosine phosphorylase/[glutamate--ammonia-ligase] adenylyltransferase [Planctomycetota bacterium]|nr:MAG: bifunctional [glutamate--ammonia ligase]-adenylyl-L-tyrosine phosphorylase/[glutamate--ammonia-ligase] adenylyltransferase [Planctomycetota bacterium]